VSGQEYVVKPGDCISSVAEAHGLFWETVWNDPGNAELRRRRKDPNVLQPGDRLTIPERRSKQVEAATEQRHRFQRKGVPAKLSLKIMDNGQPRAGERYVLSIDGAVSEGTLDENGGLEVRIPPLAREGRLLVGDEMEEYRLSLGHLDPIDAVSGVQARLTSLGYDCGGADGELGPQTRDALRRFQRDEGLDATGEPDGATRDALLARYGC
jgi:Putative peptidoglycan binding domain/LysM domain